MILKALGITDIVVAILLVLADQGMSLNRIYFFFVILHAVKALFFIRSLLSLLDLVVVAYTLIFPFWNHPGITLLVAIFLIVKGLYSLF